MHGLEVLRRVKEYHSEFQVILITGQSDLLLAFQGMKENAFDFVVRPHDLETLVEKIRTAACTRHEVLENRNTKVMGRLLRD